MEYQLGTRTMVPVGKTISRRSPLATGGADGVTLTATSANPICGGALASILPTATKLDLVLTLASALLDESILVASLRRRFANAV